MGYRLLLLAFAIINLSSARSFAEIKKSKKLVVGTNGTFTPFSIFEKGKLTGFEIDLANAIAKELKLESQWKTARFDTLLIGLSQNRYDLVIASHGITEERKKSVEFTNPYYCSGAIIVSKPKGPLSVADLKGRVVGTQVGTTYYKFLKGISGIKDVLTYGTEPETLMALTSGKIDAMIGDKIAVTQLIKSLPDSKLQTGEVLYEEQAGMAIKKGNHELVDAVNLALRKILENGQYTELSKKYFSQDIRCSSPSSAKVTE